MKLKSPFSIFILAILYGFTIIQGGHGFGFPQEFTNSEFNTFELTEKQHSHVYVAHEIVEYGSNSTENLQPVKNRFFHPFYLVHHKQFFKTDIYFMKFYRSF